MGKVLTVTEVAARLRVSRVRVWQLIKSGRLKAEKVGNFYTMKESEVDRAVYRPVGRPRKDGKK